VAGLFLDDAQRHGLASTRKSRSEEDPMTKKRAFELLGIKSALLPLAALCGLSACSSAAHNSAAAGAAGSTATPEKLVAPFEVAKGELPEGLAIGDGVPYVGLAPTGQIGKVNLSDGSLSTFATLPAPVPNKGFMTGLAFSAKDAGVLYAALVSFVPEVQAGIYRVGAAGGKAELFAKSADMVFPNGLIADEAGDWFVADSNAGAVFKVSQSGSTVDKWLSDDALAGDSAHSCASAKGAGLPFNIGANGITKLGDALYVTNTDKGSVVRIALTADGKAGKVSLLAGPDCATLGGADGITTHAGALYVANNFLNRVVRLDAQGEVTTVAAGAPLDFPASLVFDAGALYVTNFAFMNAQSGKGSPGLIRIETMNE
jgi:sugar lactone lactonase YvrE